jgi:hypothetical protein
VRIAEHGASAANHERRENIWPVRLRCICVLEEHCRDEHQELSAEDQPLRLDPFREPAGEGYREGNHADWKCADRRGDGGPLERRLPERDEKVEDGRPPEVREDGNEEKDREVDVEPCPRWSDVCVSAGRRARDGMSTYTAALEAGMVVSYHRKTPMRTMERIRGTSTSADVQPAVVPDVVAKINSTSATAGRRQFGT